VIFDGEPRATALDAIRTLSVHQPDIPIILHPRVEPGVAEFLIAAGRTAQVTGTLAFGNAEDVERLASALGEQIAIRPEATVQRVLSALLPNVPSRVQMLARRTLRRRATGARCTLVELARDLAASENHVGRGWPANLPPPGDFVRWITLLYAAHVREWSGVGWDAIARAMGIGENTLRRLRQRIPGGPDVFAECVISLATRCGIAEPVARDVLERSA